MRVANRTLKDLQETFKIGALEAKLLRDIARFDLDPRQHPGIFTSLAAWVRKCYHKPNIREAALFVANELIDAHGVESFETTDGRTVAYCNMGETYATTILQIDQGHLLIGCWGDIAERWAR